MDIHCVNKKQKPNKHAFLIHIYFTVRHNCQINLGRHKRITEKQHIFGNGKDTKMKIVLHEHTI